MGYVEKNGIVYPLTTDKININTLNSNFSVLAARQRAALVGYSAECDYVVSSSGTPQEIAWSFYNAMKKALEENMTICIENGNYYCNRSMTIGANQVVFGEGYGTNLLKIGDSTDENTVFILNGTGASLFNMTITSEDSEITSPYYDVEIRERLCRIEELNFVDLRELAEDKYPTIKVTGEYSRICGCMFTSVQHPKDIEADVPCLAIGNVFVNKHLSVSASVKCYGNLEVEADA